MRKTILSSTLGGKWVGNRFHKPPGWWWQDYEVLGGKETLELDENVLDPTYDAFDEDNDEEIKLSDWVTLWSDNPSLLSRIVQDSGIRPRRGE